ncbi:uncharacterized protein LOC105843363 [Hydra vulgaris]|uniref:Uncharacterized protein LOC105843363 n=1 Tax=Hydra vulgaris TaxID=6087 RepID=A0ABM4BYS9_HYDVU
MLAKSLKITLWAIAITLMVGISCFLAAACGNSWWKSSLNDTEIGLLNFNIKGRKEQRKNLFQFKSFDLDNILILITFAIIFSTLSLVCLLVLCFFKEKNSTWTKGSFVLICLVFMAGACGIGAMLYAEIFVPHLWRNNKHGWSVISAWFGAIACITALIISCNAAASN